MDKSRIPGVATVARPWGRGLRAAAPADAGPDGPRAIWRCPLVGGGASLSAWLILWCLLASGILAQEAQRARSLESMYPGVAALRTAAHEVVCLVDTEHPEDRRKELRDRAPKYLALERVRLCIELETAGLPCLLAHASMLSPEDLARPRVKAVVVYGRNRRTGAEEDGRLFALLRECRAPMLCLGGAQGLMATAHGGKVGTMRQLKPGEADPDPSYVPGVFKEVGFTKVRIVAPDAIFEGLGEAFEVMERHSTEVKALPPEFDVLASTDACRVQVCRHRGRTLYGMQFSPDRFDERHPDGRRLLQNFFSVAGVDTAARIPEARAAFRARTRALVGKVCEAPSALSDPSGPFVAVVDMEDPEVIASPRKGSGTGLTHAEKIARLKSRIEGELAGLPCVVVHYIEAQEQDFANPHLRAIVITGAGSPTADPMTRDLFAVIRDARVPIMGLCAGHQHIAEAHGVGTANMRPLREGEKDPHPKYHPGMFKEWDFLPVRILKRDPLFDGLPDTIVVQEYHVAEVKSLPEGFDLLASTEDCEIQAIRLRGKPVYGTQFHSECYDEARPDGRRVLQNFFRIAAEARGGNR